MKALDSLLQRFRMLCHVQSPFSRYLLAVLWNQADIIGENSERSLHNFRGISHFEVQFCNNALSQAEHIPILNMSPVDSQMHRNPARARALASRRSLQDVRLSIWRVGHVRVACLPQRRNMVDIYS